jgi:carbonic anhydrase
MSIFDKADTWADTDKGCGAPHQSPVNLSRSFALPCDRLCELVIDKVSVPQATATIKSETGMHLEFGEVKPTAKFNGEGYTCKEAFLLHPAQHTVEDIRAEAEFIALFENPKGYQLAVSVPVRTSPGETPSTAFFSAFVPYPSVPDEPTTVVLGSAWELQDVIPESKGFYVYEGAWIMPPCTADVTWCVFGSSITIDPSDYARLASKSPGGSRPLQPVGDREVFFNDGEKIENAYSKKDGKVYMRCKRVTKEGETKESSEDIRRSTLADDAAKAAQDAQTVAVNNLNAQMGDLYSSVGGIWGILMVLVFIYVTYQLFSEKGEALASRLLQFLLYFPSMLNRFVEYLKSFVFTKSSPPVR